MKAVDVHREIGELGCDVDGKLWQVVFLWEPGLLEPGPGRLELHRSPREEYRLRGYNRAGLCVGTTPAMTEAAVAALVAERAGAPTARA